MSQKTAVPEEMTREEVAQRLHDLAEEFESGGGGVVAVPGTRPSNSSRPTPWGAN